MDVEREWLDLVASLLGAPMTVLPEGRLAATLMATFDAPACAFHTRPGPGAVVQRIYPEGMFSAAQQAEWLRLSIEEPACHPLLHYYLRTGDPRPAQIADVPSSFAGPRVRARFVELLACPDLENQLAIPLPTCVDGPRWFALGGPEPFTDRQMALARRVQKLIVGLDRQAAVLKRWQSRIALPEAAVVAPLPEAAVVALPEAAVVALPEAAEDVRLTPRELSVLLLVTDGLTAAAAGRRLVVAERTVHKHLERIYAKLGVSDRVSAVLRAQRLGILPERALAVAR